MKAPAQSFACQQILFSSFSIFIAVFLLSSPTLQPGNNRSAHRMHGTALELRGGEKAEVGGSVLVLGTLPRLRRSDRGYWSSLTCRSDSQPVTRRALPAAGSVRAAGWAFHPISDAPNRDRTSSFPSPVTTSALAPAQPFETISPRRPRVGPKPGALVEQPPRSPPRTRTGGGTGSSSRPRLRHPAGRTHSLHGAGCPAGPGRAGGDAGGAERRGRAPPTCASRVPPPRRGPRPMGGAAAPPSLCAVTCAGARRAAEAGRAARGRRSEERRGLSEVTVRAAGGRCLSPARPVPSGRPAPGYPGYPGCRGVGRLRERAEFLGAGEDEEGKEGAVVVQRSLPRVYRGAGCRAASARLRAACRESRVWAARRDAGGGRRRCDAPEG